MSKLYDLFISTTKPKPMTQPTIEDVLNKYFTYYHRDFGEAIKAAMTEWEQISKAPLLKRIEGLEEDIELWKKANLSSVEIIQEKNQRISELEKENAALKNV